MEIKLATVLVDDQEKALRFYTDKLGFVKKTDIPMGEHRWLTVSSQNDERGIELLLEPNAFKPAKIYQQALYDANIPCTMFHVEDLDVEYERLKEAGVEFTMEPMLMGPVKMAIFNDTCGNKIQIVEVLYNEMMKGE
jgi:predicted enzyme related to lactoylglutathione lyase